MKPLSEFAEALRKQKSHTYASENGDYYRGFDVGVAHAVALLEAWIEGRHKEFEQAAANQRPDAMGPRWGAAMSEARNWIRTELLGTTRQKDGK